MLYCCIPLGCIHPIPTWQTLITLITLLTESFLTIWTDNVQLPVNGHCKSRYLAINVICTTVLSLNIQLWYCIAVFHRLHPNTTYMPNTDDTVYTDNRVVFIIWTDNVNAICTTTISSNIQLWYCIAVFPRLYPCNTYLPNTDYTNYTGYRVVFNHLHRKRWLPSTGIHFFHLAVGTSLAVRAQLHWIKVGQEGRQEALQEGYFQDRYLENAIIYPQTLS